MIPFSCSLYGTLHPEAPGAVVLKPGVSTASLSCQLCLFSLTLLGAFADKYWIITSYSPISFSSVGNKLEWVTLITWLHLFLCYSIILLVSECMGWGDACLYTHEHRPHMWKIEHILKFHIETVSLVCCYMHQAPWQEFPGILLSLCHPSLSLGCIGIMDICFPVSCFMSILDICPTQFLDWNSVPHRCTENTCTHWATFPALYSFAFNF